MRGGGYIIHVRRIKGPNNVGYIRKCTAPKVPPRKAIAYTATPPYKNWLASCLVAFARIRNK